MSLEKRIEKIEFQLKSLSEDIDLGREYIFLDIDKTKMNDIYTVFEKYFKSIITGKDVDRDVFEDELLKILHRDYDKQHFDYHTIEMLCQIFYEKGKYKEIYKKFYLNK